jgi:hypothetical protein
MACTLAGDCHHCVEPTCTCAVRYGGRLECYDHCCAQRTGCGCTRMCIHSCVCLQLCMPAGKTRTHSTWAGPHGRTTYDRDATLSLHSHVCTQMPVMHPHTPGCCATGSSPVLCTGWQQWHPAGTPETLCTALATCAEPISLTSQGLLPSKHAGEAA